MDLNRFSKGKAVDFEKSSLVHYIEKIALQYPNNTAVVHDNDKIDYTTLNKAANQIAGYLISEENIVPGDLIGVYFTPSIDLIISILAIIKSGAAYVPLDLTYPKNFLEHIVNNSKPKIILTNIDNQHLVTRTTNIQNVDTNKYSTDNLAIQLTSESPAYVIYTSGSTGKPKGAVIPHRAVINHMLWLKDAFQFTTSDKILLKTPLTFDPSVWEIFLPLFTGAELIISPAGSHIDTYLLLKSIIKHKVTTIQLVPGILHKFLNHSEIKKCFSLQRIFVGGESLSSKIKKLSFSKLNCPVINLYGPTETTIDITYHVIENTPEDIERNYIGKPIYNTDLYILNESMELCDINEPGELYVSGECLGLGYLNRPDITKDSFIANPFSHNQLMYKTGDIVRLTKNGLIEYICRKDKQIKINGVRIEPDAILSKITEKHNVSNCLIIKNNDETIYSYLICYIIPEKDKHIDITEIKNTLSNFFPKAVIPKEFYCVDEIPTLPNGKVDINKLLEYSDFLKDKKIESFATENNIQKDLINTCRKFLNNSDLNLDDDLYYSGMDSLFCLLLMEHIEKNYHIDLFMHEVLANKTIRSLSDLISKKIKCTNFNAESSNTLIALKSTGSKIPTFLIHPIGGTIFWYNHIAKYFDSERALYGIQDPGIESEDYFFDSLEEMAEYYLTLIKNVQPSGPYIIGGASFGATIAVEICRNLNKNEVVAIPILDGWAIYPDNLKDENYFRKSMIKQQSDWKIKFGAYGYNEFKKLFATQKHRLELLYKYRMSKINHDILLFKSKEIMDVFVPINNYDNNWRKYVSGELRIINVNGSHETMFQSPYVEDLSLTLSALLNEKSIDC